MPRPALDRSIAPAPLISLVPTRCVGTQCRTRRVLYLYDVYFYLLPVTRGAARL